MARKTSQYRVDDAGRDFGKVFLLTEMPAAAGERWATRAFLALAEHGIEMPDGLAQSGLAGIAQYGFGLIGKLPFETAMILMDEMFACVTIIPNPSSPNIVRNLVEDDIEEIATRIKLRVAVFKLHVPFPLAADPSISAPASAA